jgi:hypothetical protein
VCSRTNETRSVHLDRVYEEKRRQQWHSTLYNTASESPRKNFRNVNCLLCFRLDATFINLMRPAGGD